MEDNYRTYYEVSVYSFYDGNGDGIGDLAGLKEKLYVFINVSEKEAVLDLSENETINRMKIENGLYTGEESGSIENGLLTIPGHGIILMSGK